VGGSAERGPGAAQVVSGDHQPNATEGGVGEVDVTPCRRPERGQTLDVHAARTGSLTEASQLAGAIVKNHQHVCCYFRSDAATRQGRRQEIN
jgi:hypothetical protein